MKPWLPTFLCSSALHGALVVGAVSGHFAAKSAAKVEPIHISLTHMGAPAPALASGNVVAQLVPPPRAEVASAAVQLQAVSKPTTKSPKSIRKVPAAPLNQLDQVPPTPRLAVAATGASTPISSEPTSLPRSFGGGGATLIRATVDEPDYTGDALAAGYEGILVVELVVDEQGEVAQAKLRNPSGFAIDGGVLAAARSARYLPAKGSDGRVAATTAQLKFNFRLSDAGQHHDGA